MKTALIFFPEARKEGLITKEVDGELLVYDRDHDQAHCLNPTAAAIWKHCDGLTSATEIARKLGGTGVNVSPKTAGTSTSANEEVVWLGLEDLRKKDLLNEATMLSTQLNARGMSRREALRRIGIGAAIALPIISTIVAPTPAQAATCKGNGQPCSASADCCSGLCNPPTGGTCVGPVANPEGRTRRS